MKHRVLTALPLGAFVAYLVLQSRQWPFVLALVIVVEVGLHEFFAICRNSRLGGLQIFGYVAGGVLCLAQASALQEAGIFAVLFLIVLLAPVFALPVRSGLKDYLGVVATTVFGILYVAFTLSWLIPLRYSDPDAGRALTLLLFLVIWADDIFAYLVGRTVGRTPLYARVSPKKTVEGSAAGLLGAMIVGWSFAHWFWKSVDGRTVLLLSMAVAIAGQVGDLVESALKRGANMKDSGSLLPGHGGLLDRIDSLLFGAPVLWLVWELRGLWHA